MELNHHKSELICADQAGLALLHLAPDLCRVRSNTATLLGSPIGWSVDEALLDKVEALRKIKSRLSLQSSQDALIINSSDQVCTCRLDKLPGSCCIVSIPHTILYISNAGKLKSLLIINGDKLSKADSAFKDTGIRVTRDVSGAKGNNYIINHGKGLTYNHAAADLIVHMQHGYSIQLSSMHWKA